MADCLEAGALLVVGLHNRPRGCRGVGVEEHGLLGLGVGVPLVEACEVGRGELPLADRVVAARREAVQLLFAADGEPELDQVDAGVDEHVLKLRGRAGELEVLFRRAVAHDALNAGTVVPGAVEQDDFAGCRQVVDVALEVPLGLFALSRLFEGDDAGAARVEVLHEPLDGSALACCVAAFEDDDELLAAFLDPGLQLQQFDLQCALGALVFLAAELFVVRVVDLPRVRLRSLALFQAVAQRADGVDFVGEVRHTLGCEFEFCVGVRLRGLRGVGRLRFVDCAGRGVGPVSGCCCGLLGSRFRGCAFRFLHGSGGGLARVFVLSVHNSTLREFTGFMEHLFMEQKRASCRVVSADHSAGLCCA